MEEHIIAQLQIWSLVAFAELTAFSMTELGVVAQAFAYICGGIASLATAYYYVFIKK